MEFKDAITYLLDDFALADKVYDVRERADYHALSDGESSWDHPDVKKFSEAFEAILKWRDDEGAPKASETQCPASMIRERYDLNTRIGTWIDLCKLEEFHDGDHKFKNRRMIPCSGWLKRRERPGGVNPHRMRIDGCTLASDHDGDCLFP